MWCGWRRGVWGIQASASKERQGVCFDFTEESFGITTGFKCCKKDGYRFLEISRESAYTVETNDL